MQLGIDRLFGCVWCRACWLSCRIIAEKSSSFELRELPLSDSMTSRLYCDELNGTQKRSRISVRESTPEAAAELDEHVTCMSPLAARACVERANTSIEGVSPPKA